MACKVGPPSEFHEELEKTFTACIEALKDDEGWNDRGASACWLSGPSHRCCPKTIVDWKGVKNGVIRIAKEKVHFKEWLRI